MLAIAEAKLGMCRVLSAAEIDQNVEARASGVLGECAGMDQNRLINGRSFSLLRPPGNDGAVLSTVSPQSGAETVQLEKVRKKAKSKKRREGPKLSRKWPVWGRGRADGSWACPWNLGPRRLSRSPGNPPQGGPFHSLVPSGRPASSSAAGMQSADGWPGVRRAVPRAVASLRQGQSQVGGKPKWAR